MRLKKPLLKLPIEFSAEALAAEVRALPSTAWVPHPTRFVGNEAVRLVTPGGTPTDTMFGAMAPTEDLLRCSYIMDVMAALGAVWGRSRLMGLAAGAEVPRHVDCHYYWRTHVRLHVPVITNPAVLFTCGDDTVHMAAGECWVFDTFQRHTVVNGGGEQRVHLVLDTVGSERLWSLIDAAQQHPTAVGTPERVEPGSRNGASLMFEQVNAPSVMSPWEVRCHAAFIEGHLNVHPLASAAMAGLERFAMGWAAAWARFGPSDSGAETYRALQAEAQRELGAFRDKGLTLRNDVDFALAANQLILMHLLGHPSPQERPAAVPPGKERIAW